MTAIPHPLVSSAQARPTHPALITAAGPLTFAELLDRVARCATALQHQGVRAGHRVALIGTYDETWVVHIHALGYLGAVAVPLRADWVLEDSARNTVLNTLKLDALISTDRSTPEWLHNTPTLAACPQESPHTPAPERFWPLDEVRVVLLTTGTTGLPKAVELTTQQIVFSAFGASIRLGHLPNDVWLACLPLHHVGGLQILFRAMLQAIPCILHARFDAQAVANALDHHNVTLVSLVPTMLEQVLEARGQPRMPFPNTLRAILLGGAPASPALLARCAAIKAPVAVTWGMTETASQIATRAPGDLTHNNDCGAPLAFARVEMSENNDVLSVRGPIAPGGRFSTRDRGFVDARGAVHITGRSDDVIISGGENIDPQELEAVLLTHPAVRDAAVLGIADAKWGERPIAVVVMATPSIPTEALRTWCEGKVQSFKIPDAFYDAPTLPRNALGKLERATLRAALPSLAGDS